MDNNNNPRKRLYSMIDTGTARNSEEDEDEDEETKSERSPSIDYRAMMEREIALARRIRDNFQAIPQNDLTILTQQLSPREQMERDIAQVRSRRIASEQADIISSQNRASILQRIFSSVQIGTANVLLSMIILSLLTTGQNSSQIIIDTLGEGVISNIYSLLTNNIVRPIIDLNIYNFQHSSEIITAGYSNSPRQILQAILAIAFTGSSIYGATQIVSATSNFNTNVMNFIRSNLISPIRQRIGQGIAVGTDNSIQLINNLITYINTNLLPTTREQESQDTGSTSSGSSILSNASSQAIGNAVEHAYMELSQTDSISPSINATFQALAGNPDFIPSQESTLTPSPASSQSNSVNSSPSIQSSRSPSILSASLSRASSPGYSASGSDVGENDSDNELGGAKKRRRKTQRIKRIKTTKKHYKKTKSHHKRKTLQKGGTRRRRTNRKRSKK